MMRSRVDLPQPDRPTTATNSPSRMSRLSPRNASTEPDRPVKVCETSIKRIIRGPPSTGAVTHPIGVKNIRFAAPTHHRR